MRVYISGPMTGLPDHNFPAFEAAASRLRGEGHDVVSPHELTLAHYGTLENAARYPWKEHLKVDVTALPSVDEVVVLPGWPASRGARLEVAIARELGIRVSDYETGLELSPVKSLLTRITEAPIVTAQAFGPGEDYEGREAVFDHINVNSTADPGGGWLSAPPAYPAPVNERSALPNERVTDPVTGAIKADGGKARTDLLPVGPLMDTAAVFAFGARKYSDRNWELGFDWSRPYGALLRHLFAWWGGQDADPETGLPHLAHAACCLLMLQEYSSHSLAGRDDRPTRKEQG